MEKGTIFNVLDQGFIRYIDSMGTDNDIVKAARISYGKSDEERSEEENRNLIRYMMSGAYEMKCIHSSVFEQVSLKIQIRIPMDHWRQLIRHRSFKFCHINEYSTRYSEAIDEMAKTAPDKWRTQSKSNKQGSGEYIPTLFDQDHIPNDNDCSGTYLSGKENMFHLIARELYEQRLKAGVAREQARKDLPLSTYTEVIITMDLWNLLHFCKLRMDSHAQLEIREYANIIGNEIVSQLWPLSWEAFQDYVFQAITFSRRERNLLAWMLINGQLDSDDVLLKEKLPNKREQEAFKKKIERILNESS